VERAYVHRRWTARSLLVIAQVTVSVGLVVTALLFVRNLSLAQTSNPGFDTTQTLVAQVGLVESRYTPERRVAMLEDAVDRVASLPGVVTEHPAWRGIRSVWYAENWEDPDGFRPYVYVGVAPEDSSRWRNALTKYEFVGGKISSFAYLDYYSALMTVRGAESRRGRAVSFDVDQLSKRRVIDSLP